MPAAIAVPAIIGAASAGTSLVAAKMGSNAAHNAANIQSQSADKAQAFNQQVYNDQKQSMAPYMNAGTTSLANLMAQHWGGQPQQYGLPQGAPMSGQGSRPLATFNQPQGPQGGGGMVQMRAPDGSVRPVPPQLVDKYRAKGAMVMQ